MNLKIVPTPEFKKQVKKLAKHYRNIHQDLSLLKTQLNQNPQVGIDLGNNCYKIRLANSSIPTGKSGGFRIITYYIDGKGIVRLLYIFSKKDQENISDSELQEIIKRTLQ